MNDTNENILNNFQYLICLTSYLYMYSLNSIVEFLDTITLYLLMLDVISRQYYDIIANMQSIGIF